MGQSVSEQEPSGQPLEPHLEGGEKITTVATLESVTVSLGDFGTGVTTGGNALGVFRDVPGLPERTRQEVAADLGFAETVFVEDLATGQLHIHTPTTELPLAGHP